MLSAIRQELIFSQPTDDIGNPIDGELKAESVLYPGEFWLLSECNPGEWEIDCTYKPLLNHLSIKNGSVERACEAVIEAEEGRDAAIGIERVCENKWDRY
jgi:hypothetical protein